MESRLAKLEQEFNILENIFINTSVPKILTSGSSQISALEMAKYIFKWLIRSKIIKPDVNFKTFFTSGAAKTSPSRIAEIVLKHLPRSGFRKGKTSAGTLFSVCFVGAESAVTYALSAETMAVSGLFCRSSDHICYYTEAGAKTLHRASEAVISIMLGTADSPNGLGLLELYEFIRILERFEISFEFEKIE